MVTVQKQYLTREVMEAIRRIDLQFYANIGPIEWYLQRFHSRQYTYTAADAGRIIGYCSTLPVRKELYDAIVSGVLIDDMGINPNMYIEESEYYYAVSIAVDRAYQKQGISASLQEAFLRDHPDKKICLITVSPEGRCLAARYFRQLAQLTENVYVFVSRNA